MAFGFQNCCDGTEYFYVNGIPSSVSELEVYYIDTEEGLDFCASYVELPELYYQPKTYNLVGMTAQTNCLSCTTSHPCPDIIDDNIDELSSYITTTTNECSIITESFFEVSCVQTSVPTYSNPNGGVVSLNITGGVPPYLIYSSNTTTQLAGSSNPGVIQVLTNKPGGTYLFDIVDFTTNTLNVSCTLPTAPTLLTSSCNTQNISQFGLSDGKLFYPTIQGGTPPYFVYSGSTLLTQSNFPINNLGINGNPRILTIQDSGTGGNFQQTSLSCTITQPAQVFIYPNNLCLQFEYCGKGFSLSFVSAGTINNRASYTLSNASSIGVSSTVTLSYNGTNWVTSSFTSTVPITLPNGCSTNTVSSTFTGPTTQYPMGSWSVNSSSWLRNDGVNNTIFTLYSGTCQNTTITPTITTQGYCSASPTPQGIVTFSPVIGGSSPYTFIVDNNLAGSNVTTSSVTSLTSGAHTYTITDQTGSTVTGSFTIPSTAGATLQLSVSNNLNTNTTTNTTVSSISVRSTYRKITTNISIPNIPSGNQLQGYFEITLKWQGAYTSNYYEQLGGTVDFSIPSILKNSTNVISQLSQIGSTTDTGSITRGSGNVSPNFITSAKNSICPSYPSAGNTSTYTRKIKKVYNLGTSVSPITLTNSDTIKIITDSSYNFRPLATASPANACDPGFAIQMDVKFIQTSSTPTCSTSNFGTSSIISYKQIANSQNPTGIGQTNFITI